MHTCRYSIERLADGVLAVYDHSQTRVVASFEPIPGCDPECRRDEAIDFIADLTGAIPKPDERNP
jgi:hypothetical protein